ncbi:MAG: HEPN domain-containing protein [Deltaproteobacteria bacterium]|jgi:HEPN domain-containing protein|nr:HEPN domain-containing protein [Deltaproteobacteria bacterium]MCL5880264.1 HEPN domain-containing protein [Deltaproteobacteria bacterium]MDA8303578.1 HEPN domain-containing protein [Deltaproteobacteria bacterium]
MIINTEKEFLEFVKQQENNFSSSSVSGEYAQIFEAVAPYTLINAEISTKTFASGVRNLIAARLLYKKNIRSLAIYHLQQALELLIKWRAYFLLDKENVRNSSHNMKSLIGKVFQKEGEIRNDILNKINPPYKSENKYKYDDFFNIIFDNQFEQIKIAKYSKEEILNKREKVIKKIQKEVRGLHKIVHDLHKDSNFINLKNVTEEIFQKRGKNDVCEFVDPLFTTVFKLSYVPTFYGYITYPHQNYTRYSDREIKPIDYENGFLGISQPEVFNKIVDDIYRVLIEFVKNFL